MTAAAPVRHYTGPGIAASAIATLERTVRHRAARRTQLEVLTYNTHVGTAIGGLRWLLRQRPRTAVVCLQEVQTRRAKLAVRAVLRPGKWLTAGPPLNSPAGTIVYVRRARFTKLANYHTRITPGPDQGALPARYLDGGVFRDHHTGRVLDVTSVHTWAMGKGLRRADARVRDAHIAQVEAVANHHGPQHVDRGDGDVVRLENGDALDLAAGDFNEDLDGTGANPPTARHTMREGAVMVPAATVTRAGDEALNLDEVFIRPRPWLAVLDRRVLHPPARLRGVEGEHPGVWVKLHLEVLR